MYCLENKQILALETKLCYFLSVNVNKINIHTDCRDVPEKVEGKKIK